MIFSGNEALVGADGYGVGTYLLLNTGCMSHGTLGTPSHGRSKALSMGLVLIICPLKPNQSMSFRNAWYAANMMDLKPHHSTLLTLLNQAVDQNFWVSGNLGQG